MPGHHALEGDTAGWRGEPLKHSRIFYSNNEQYIRCEHPAERACASGRQSFAVRHFLFCAFILQAEPSWSPAYVRTCNAPCGGFQAGPNCFAIAAVKKQG